MPDETMQFLERYAKQIEQRADAGDAFANQVIDLYTLHYQAPQDPGARGLLEAAVAAYRKEYPNG